MGRVVGPSGLVTVRLGILEPVDDLGLFQDGFAMGPVADHTLVTIVQFPEMFDPKVLSDGMSRLPTEPAADTSSTR